MNQYDPTNVVLIPMHVKEVPKLTYKRGPSLVSEHISPKVSSFNVYLISLSVCIAGQR